MNLQSYDIKAITFGDLIEPIERHNLLFLPNKNYVFACYGFFSKACEYTNIYEETCKSINPFKKSR